MTTILIVEDEESIGQALEYQLRREGFHVSWTKDGASGLRAFEVSEPDLVLLDLMLPGMSGEDLCKRIRKTSQVPIVVLTAKDTEVDTVVGLELGADDYVTKPFSMRELVARIRAVLRRSQLPEARPAVLEGGGIVLDPERFEASVRGKPIRLTLKEFQLLEVLMINAGRVVTREALIEDVWGSDYVGDTRTLDVHIKRLRAKCEEDPRLPKHIQTVRGLGYKFVP
ncbi:MAG: winged helix-turn-helix domain-containing protein [Actinomycetota bacterium]